MRVKKVHPGARVPTKGSEGAGCYDLYCVEDTYIKPGETAKLSTGLAFEVPQGFCMHIYLRSSMGAKGIMGNVGIVDSDYRGTVFICVTNVGKTTFSVQAGDRIGQCQLVTAFETGFEVVPKLSETERGEGGFGSTGR